MVEKSGVDRVLEEMEMGISLVCAGKFQVSGGCNRNWGALVLSSPAAKRQSWSGSFGGAPYLLWRERSSVRMPKQSKAVRVGERTSAGAEHAETAEMLSFACRSRRPPACLLLSSSRTVYPGSGPGSALILPILGLWMRAVPPGFRPRILLGYTG